MNKVKKTDPTPPPSNEERLEEYGLSSQQVRMEDLVVGENEYIRLTLRGDVPNRYAKLAQHIRVESIAHLKRLIGVPDQVVQKQCVRPCEENLTEVISPEFNSLTDLSTKQFEVLQLAANEFIYGNSEAIAIYEPALNKAISSVIRSRITLLPFNDIIVERGGVLELDGSAEVIFANKVLIKQGGKIRLTGTVKIDCNSIQGEEVPFAVGTVLSSVRRR